jgi:hypothetical protein
VALSFQALQDLWKQAGGSPASAAVAAAIALAESGGRPDAHNPKPPDDSYGLWQINMLGSLGPARRRQFGLSSNAALFDPLTNAKAAVAISGGGSSFGAWSTYTNGAYKSHLSGQGSGTDTIQGGTGGGQPGGTNWGGIFGGLLGGLEGLGPLGTTLGTLFGNADSQLNGSPFSAFLGPLAPIAEGFALFSQFMSKILTKIFLPSTWVRIASFTFGAICIMAGLFIFFVGAAPVRAAERIVSDVV